MMRVYDIKDCSTGPVARSLRGSGISTGQEVRGTKSRFGGSANAENDSYFHLECNKLARYASGHLIRKHIHNFTP
jgi:hypothetical protein